MGNASSNASDNVQQAVQKDVFVAIACWINLALTVLAVLCGVFYGLLLLNSGTITSLWAYVPLIYAVITLIFQSVLSREHWRSASQYSQARLLFILLAGGAALLGMAVSLTQTKDAMHPVIIIPFLIGCLSFAAVLRIILKRYTAAGTAFS